VGEHPVRRCLQDHGRICGIYILELQERFFENGYSMLEEALQDLRNMLEQVEAEKGESTGQADVRGNHV